MAYFNKLKIIYVCFMVWFSFWRPQGLFRGVLLPTHIKSKMKSNFKFGVMAVTFYLLNETFNSKLENRYAVKADTGDLIPLTGKVVKRLTLSIMEMVGSSILCSSSTKLCWVYNRLLLSGPVREMGIFQTFFKRMGGVF